MKRIACPPPAPTAPRCAAFFHSRCVAYKRSPYGKFLQLWSVGQGWGLPCGVEGVGVRGPLPAGLAVSPASPSGGFGSLLCSGGALCQWCSLVPCGCSYWGCRRTQLRFGTAACKERSTDFFPCPQRIDVLELSSRLHFFSAEQQICFKFGSRQRRAGGRNFPGIALHFPLKGLCFGAGD